MPSEDLTNDQNATEVSTQSDTHSIQCVEIFLRSSQLKTVSRNKTKNNKSGVKFKITAFVEDRAAVSNFHVQIIRFDNDQENPTGYHLRFTLSGIFIAGEGLNNDDLADFVRLYTLPILWPYAREYASDQLRRTGESFDSLPIINPQAVTERLINTDMVRVSVNDSSTT